jgi:glycosyltransferase involved in cell wall biosynthesis
MTNEKVSVIIPTYNRFKYLLNTIESVKNQTYNNIEIIVINDASTEKEYYDYNWEKNNIIIIHLKKNSKNIFGFACAAYVRNKGINISTGKYIAFCDDDDIWFPYKIETQIKAIKETGCKMSSTDGLFGNGIFDNHKIYKKYNSEHYYNILQNIYKSKGSNLLENGFPKIWDLNFLKIHNCIICSSVLVEKDLLNKIDNIPFLKNGEEDYACWLKLLEYTNNVYINDICFYYDGGHGDGQNY